MVISSRQGSVCQNRFNVADENVGFLLAEMKLPMLFGHVLGLQIRDWLAGCRVGQVIRHVAVQPDGKLRIEATDRVTETEIEAAADRWRPEQA